MHGSRHSQQQRLQRNAVDTCIPNPTIGPWGRAGGWGGGQACISFPPCGCRLARCLLCAQGWVGCPVLGGPCLTTHLAGRTCSDGHIIPAGPVATARQAGAKGEDELSGRLRAQNDKADAARLELTPTGHAERRPLGTDRSLGDRMGPAFGISRE